MIVALAGNPNSGKTTIFNCLTGLRQKVANYPGVTVEKKTGQCRLPDGSRATVIDLPGTYSLISRSPDEQIAMEVLRGIRPDTPGPDVVVVVVDASNLQRNLYLVSQLIELGRPMVVALNMMDVAERRGTHVNALRLQELLGVPVVPIVGHRRQGIDELKRAILRATVAPLPDFPLPPAMKDELLAIGEGLAILDGREQQDVEHSTFNIERSTSNIEHSTSNIEHSTSNIEHSTSNIEHSTSNIEHLTSSIERPTSSFDVQRSMLDVQCSSVPPRAWICRDDSARHLDRYLAIAERLLIGDRAADVEPLVHRDPVASILSNSVSRLHALGIDPMQADVEAHYRWIEHVSKAVSDVSRDTGFQPVQKASHGLEARVTGSVLDYAPKPTLTDRVDRILLHKFWGLLIFTAIMAGLFVSIFWLATPIMDGIEAAISAVAALASSGLPDGPVKDLITDGIFAGVGAVIVFVPQIALLFLFLAILEDSGYLARAAFLMDRLLSKVGLHGKSFIPLLSSFACAIPGIMAARTIENRRDRLATIFVAPFMSCSARLPVYALLIGTFFASFSPAARGGILLACYALGVVAAALTAWVFKRTLLKGAPQAFILELPTYKVPQLSQVARVVWTNTKAFIVKAGTIIFCLSVILWALMYYPRLPEEKLATAERIGQQRHSEFQSALQATPNYKWRDELKIILDPRIPAPTLVEDGFELPTVEDFEKQAVAAAQLRHSLAGRFGHLIEPAIKPLGYDWKMGVGLVGAFAAREVFVSTMGIVYSVGDDDSDTRPLAQQMQADTYPSGKPVWTPLVATSLLIWFVLAMQCMSTLAIVKRETASWLWPIGMLVYMNGLAYVVCLIVYQVGRMFVS